MTEKKLIIIIPAYLLSIFLTIFIGVKSYPIFISFFNNSGELGGLEEVPKIYSKDKTFHDYYLEYKKRKESGTNETALVVILQEHINELATPEVKNFTEQFLDYVLTENEENFINLVYKDSKTTKIYYDGSKLMDGDSENNLMFFYYLNYLYEKKSKEICAKHGKSTNCNEFMDNYSEKEYKMCQKYEEKIVNLSN